MNKKLLLTLAIVLVVAIGFVVAPDVLGRAGGGQDYVPSGGGGFDFDTGGSTFDSSSDFGGGSSYVPSTCGSGSIIGIIIFVIFIVVVSYLIKRARKAGRNAMSQTPQAQQGMDEMQRMMAGLTGAAAGGAMAGTDVKGGLTSLKQKDPNFNEQEFEGFVQNAFYKIQEAWETQDLNIARPYLSDQIMQRYTNQINDIKSRGERNVIENMVIGHQTITGVRSDAKFDYITIKIDASATDYTVDSNGKIIRGDKKIKPFTEFWTFMRKGDVKSDKKKGAQANTCPNCGAPLKLNATGKCEYCNTIVTSGEYDWVLSEITQSR